jgi:hypothetical protein
MAGVQAKKGGDAETLERNRENKWTVRIFKANGRDEHALVTNEFVKARIWDGVDESTPFLTLSSEEDTANGSTLVIDDRGDEDNDEPAIVRITITKVDAALVTMPGDGEVRKLEITTVLDDEETVVKRVPLNVEGSPD